MVEILLVNITIMSYYIVDFWWWNIIKYKTLHGANKCKQRRLNIWVQSNIIFIS